MGSTNNLKRRLIEHNAGTNTSTRRYKPWDLIYYEAFISEHLARQREQKIKQHGNTKRHLFRRLGFTSNAENSAGYTLIELLVVTSLILVIIAVVVQLFFSSLRGAAKTTVTNETRQSGDYAMSVMERMIRNAQTVESVCDGSSQSTITIKNPDSNLTIFACPADITQTAISSNSAQITSSKVTVDSVNCSFICNQAVGEPANVSINFTIHQVAPSAGVTLRPEEKNSIDFQTSVVVRNTGL